MQGTSIYSESPGFESLQAPHPGLSSSENVSLKLTLRSLRIVATLRDIAATI